MLIFLYLASKQGFQVDSHSDEVVGVTTINEAGVPRVSSITLNVRIALGGSSLPTPNDENCIHHSEHEQCFIANYIKNLVTVRSHHNTTEKTNCWLGVAMRPQKNFIRCRKFNTPFVESLNAQLNQSPKKRMPQNKKTHNKHP